MRRLKTMPVIVVAVGAMLAVLHAQQPQVPGHLHPMPEMALQPLAQHVRTVASALAYVGQPLSTEDARLIDEAIAQPDEQVAVARLQEVLDKHVLVVIDINPESRVKVSRGPARAELVEAGTRMFLVKVLNQAGVTAPLAVESPNSLPVYRRSTGSPEPKPSVTNRDVMERWAETSIFRTEVRVFSDRPLTGRLSGFPIDYQVMQVYSRDRGPRSALLSFNVGQGTQDIGFRSEIEILFNALPAYPMTLRVRDEKGRPATASLLIRDRLKRLYPSIAKRLAPDFYFQPQVYRADGDTILLPAGQYTITSTRGPEYLARTREVTVDGPRDLSVTLERWLDPAAYGWYSGDHHVHSAGCSHYESPTEGVRPEDMWPQARGEALNVMCMLTWGPCYYHQKRYFSGQDHPLSTRDQLMHYDVEVSGFPSSHAGHIVLLGLKDQDYRGATRIEQWPSWGLPVLQWAKEQNAVTGFAHSGWGLASGSTELPNYEMPAFDGIGANEYIVDVTHPNAIDFISAADTPAPWELNIWYHTLNVGFRTRLSGETDFPCISDDRVGQGRSYCKLDGPLTYRGWIDAVRNGRSYVSDGLSHLMDFSVNGREAGTGDGEVRLAAGDTARVAVKVAAYLDPSPNEGIRSLGIAQAPYWNVERARIGTTRDVPVELIVNGHSVARKPVTADGKVREVSFDVPLRQSSWLAVRIYPSSHTNPVFAIVDGRPVRASRRSAEWSLAAVNQCWTQKAPRIAAAELESARKAYEHAREVYRKLIVESPPGS